jgi:diguanylate cyclase (GGDEF)-like protein
LKQRSDRFNLAEKYLMLVIQANIANTLGQEQIVINWLNQAIAMEKHITATQLHSPEFNQSNLTLSEIYARIGQFKKAYDMQSIYIKRFYFHRLALTEQRLNRLNKKYDIDIKLKENELLQSQQEYKGLQLAKIQQKNTIQQRNILILVATIIVFFILLYRQLLIRNALGRLAKIDSMTNLYNRKMLFEAGEKLTISGSNLKQPLSVILFDIDDLKAINEQYGHHVGDEVIKSIASLGIETMRSRDVFSRVAGEQFAAILPGTNLAQAKAFAERVREKVESSHFHHQDIKGTITVSAGIANTADIDVEFELLLNAAEQALHSAKTAGKNCVFLFQTA